MTGKGETTVEHEVFGTRGWWKDYKEFVGSDFPQREYEATSIRVYSPLELPQLVRTEAYGDAMIRRRPASPAWRKRAAEVARHRQAILDRKDGTAPRVSVLTTEAALRFHWGDALDRRAQIEHLISLNARANVEIRVQVLDDGPPAPLASPVSILSFSEGAPTVFVDTSTSFAEVGGQESVDAYIKSFEEACDAALEPGDTTVYLEHLAKRME